MTRQSVELPLTARRDSLIPLATQVAGQLRDAIADGRIAAGERLPASRALAAELGVSRTVVNGAYAQLFAEGWVEGRHGSGTYVTDGAPAGPPAGAGHHHAARHTDPPVTGARARAEPAATTAPQSAYHDPAPLINLRPGIPWTPGIDKAAWRRAWRTAGLHPPAAPADPAGLAELRAALTAYLRRSRAVRCTPTDILVTRGVADGLGLIAAALLRPGDRVGVEEPGYPVARAVLTAHGAQVVPCRVDRDGLVPGELPAGLKLIYTTPSHQYPLGGRLPIPRRRALIGWARAHGTLIAEDDYDGEFRYDVAPLPALYGLDPDIVIYLGSATKTLTPALRIGWLATRPSLVTRLAQTLDQLGGWPAEPAQRAMLTLITTGDMERHIRRMRHEYTRRRAALAAVFRDGNAGHLLGDQAGLHVVLQTRHNADTAATTATRQGVAVGTLTRFFAGPATANGLVIGYGGTPLPQVTRGCRILHQILADVDSAPASLPTHATANARARGQDRPA
jgi:GntR family transcriptional regulator / MocR family aminotransferase